MLLGGEFCLVDEIEVSENKEALIVLACTVAGAMIKCLGMRQPKMLKGFSRLTLSRLPV